MLPSWKTWMAAAIHFNLCGAKSLKSTSPKMHPVKFYSASAAPPRGFDCLGLFQKLVFIL